MKIVTTALLLVIGLGIAAVTAPAVDPPPQALIKETSQRMLQALRDNRAALQQDSSRIYPLVDEIVLPHFDFGTISRWVLGRHWRKATPQQRDHFTSEFRTFLVRNYAKALLEYTDEEVRYLPMPALPSGSTEAIVRTEIQPRDGPAIPINYSMHRKSSAWKVYDVTVDGISLVTNYRGSFSSQIRKEGMDAVIAKLSERNAQSAP